jgi:1-acyl-sn-glycerol-3-phosphate acyltransferase
VARLGTSYASLCEGRSVFYWLLKHVVLGPVLKAIFRPQVDGLANVPASGPVILACNHLSFSDSIFTPLVVKRQVTFVAKAEYFTGKGIKGRLMRLFFTATGTIPVDRAGGKAAQAALDTLLRVLRAGGVAGIYPEGTRSPDGRLYRFRTGVARLALRSGAPVVPVGIAGTREVQPPGSKWWHRKPVRVSFGAPMSFGHRAAEERSARVLREVTEQVRCAVQELSGQEYVDSFASTGSAVQV